MIGWMEGALFLVCLGGVAGMWLYFFIKEAEEHTGWVRVAAFGCRMALVMMLAAAIMAFGGFWLCLGGGAEGIVRITANGRHWTKKSNDCAALSSRHSARAAARFSLKFSRLQRWRS